jgi:hypothetical protein
MFGHSACCLLDPGESLRKLLIAPPRQNDLIATEREREGNSWTHLAGADNEDSFLSHAQPSDA